MVHGDVFRPPRYGMLLSLLLGSGVQIFFMTMITLGQYAVAVCENDVLNECNWWPGSGRIRIVVDK